VGLALAIGTWWTARVCCETAQQLLLFSPRLMVSRRVLVILGGLPPPTPPLRIVRLSPAEGHPAGGPERAPGDRTGDRLGKNFATPPPPDGWTRSRVLDGTVDVEG